MKKITAILMLIVFLVSSFPNGIEKAKATVYGSYGDFKYKADNGIATINGYNGNGGAVVIPAEVDGYPVANIDGIAFAYESKITSITISEGIVNIGEGVFKNCTGLREITLPESLVSIGKGAFSCCTALTEINLPAGVTSFGYSITCDSLLNINVDSENSVYTSIDGILFNKSKTELLMYPIGRTSTSYTVPSKVKSIADNSFSGESDLTEIVLPSGLKSIGNSALSGCTGLAGITFPGNLEKIGDAAFGGCTGLESVAIPDSVTDLGFGIFQGCTGLKQVKLPQNLIILKESMFWNCSGLTDIVIPDTVTTIQGRVFCDCTSLKKITIPESVTSIGYSTFFGCSSLESFVIPDSVNQIGEDLLHDCTSLKNIKLPSGLTYIPKSMFFNCSSLESIELPENITDIGPFAFCNCSSLKSIMIPDKIVFIDRYTFSGCASLENVTLPEGLSEIDEWVFDACKSLKRIKLPNSLKKIGGYTFYNCINLTDVNIPNGVTAVSDYMFYGCSSLPNVLIPDSVNSIGKYAFQNCASLNEITIPEIVSSIGNYAFYGCAGLTGFVIPDSVTSLGSNVFEKCTGIESIIIPDSIKSIEYGTFAHCSGLKNITFHDTLSKIGEDAFFDCSALKKITIPDSVTTIGRRAFYGCSSLSAAVIPGNVTKLLDYTFYECTGLKSITLPENLTDLGAYTFDGCSGLTQITIPKGITSLKNYVFNRCGGLTTITIPKNVTSINKYAFHGCSNLISVYFCNPNIPDIASLAFHDVILTAYYPSSWSETPTSGYGGTIAWTRVDTPVISKNPVAITKAENQSANFTVTATGTDLSYQWQASTDGGNTWKNSGLSGNKTNKLTVKATTARNGYMFRCLITDCVGQTVTSKAVKLTVSAGTNIAISTQPKKVTADEGKNAVFTVSASSSTGSELSYQWQASTDAGKTWTNSGLSGNKTATLTVAATAARNGYQFRCIVSDAAGNTVTSDVATLTVKSYIKFNSQPLSQKVTNATKVKFKVSAESLTGSTLSYQWQASTDGGKTWKNSGLSGNKTAILVVDATAARSGYRFRCIVTDANGKSLTSSAAVMTVKKVADQTVTISSFTASQTALAGTIVKFNVGAKSSTGTALNYQWQASTDGGKTFKNSGLTGNKTATLTVTATTGRNNYRFRCIITDAKNNSVTSDAVKLMVK